MESHHAVIAEENYRDLMALGCSEEETRRRSGVSLEALAKRTERAAKVTP